MTRSAAEGFDWVEIRDKGVTYGRSCLAELTKVAGEEGPALHYTWDGANILDPKTASFLIAEISEENI